jgi:hypothetical protein
MKRNAIVFIVRLALVAFLSGGRSHAREGSNHEPADNKHRQ